MKKFIILILVLFISNLGFSQWRKLPNPESGVLGKTILKGNPFGMGVDTTAIKTESGVTKSNEDHVRDFKSFLGIGSLDVYKLDSTYVENIVVDYIKDENISGGKLKNKWIIYKGKRADKVILKYKKSISTRAKPKETLEKLVKQEVLKKIPLLDSLKLEYKNENEIYITIDNPKVYFEVFAVKIRRINSKNVRSFLHGKKDVSVQSEKFTLRFPDDLNNNPVLKGMKKNPEFTLKLEKDSNQQLRLFVEMGEDFADENGYATNLIEIPRRFIGKDDDGNEIFSYSAKSKYLGKATNDKSIEFHVYIDISGKTKTNSSIEFTNYKQGYYRTKLTYPMIKYKVYKGKFKS
jgi:hypothetical protein